MALSFGNLGSSTTPDINDGANATSYASASWTPPSSGLIIVFVASAVTTGTAVEPTMSGNSLTWTKIVSHVAEPSGNAQRITLFAANASGSSTGATTIDFGAETQLCCNASFFSVDNADLSGGVAAAFVQTPAGDGAGATSGSVSLSAAGSSDNRAIAAFMHAANEATTPRTNWTELDDFNGTGPTRGFETQYRGDAFETTASATWTTSSNWVGLAAEIKAAAAGATYTLTAAAGSYSLSGKNTALQAARKLALAAGTYALTGVSTALRASRKIVLAAGSYALTGADATLQFTRKLSAAAGTYTLTGVDATLKASRVLTAESGTYVLTGRDAAIAAARKLLAQTGAYTLTGYSVTLTYSGAGAATYTIELSAGSYTLSGQTAALVVSRKLAASAGVYVLTGEDATIKAARVLLASAGVYAVTGNVAGLLVSRVLNAQAGTYSLTGQAAPLRAARVLSAAAGAFSLTGNAAVVRAARKLLAARGVYTLAGNAAALVYNGAADTFLFITATDGGVYELLAVTSDSSAAAASDTEPYDVTTGEQ